ncbi:MAG: metallophosphoesterase family protein [Silicimonas sp.]|nr:metallophosphoesterase family protein [Silicimonas sp.]
MRIAALSDIHGNITALRAVLADIERRGITKIVNLGDTVSGPFDAAGTADLLMQLDIPTVRGNHDRQLFDRPASEMGRWEAWVIDDLADRHIGWLKSFPLTLEVDGVFLCHATPAKDDENWLDYRGPDDRLITRDLPDVAARSGGIKAPIILCGHTHAPRVVRLPNGPMVVNTGSVGCPAYLDIRCEPHFVQQTGAPDARYAVVEFVAGRWQADLIAVPYDPTDMVKLAREKGADSWERAITTGWMA